MRSISIQSNDAGQRLDKFMLKSYKNLPKSILYKSIRKKRIKLNNKRCDMDTVLKEGDILSLFINDEFLERTPCMEFLKAPAELAILYEDENIVLADKPVGVPMHSNQMESSVDNLVNRLKHYLYQKGEYNPQTEQSFSPAFCNRIDRNTGGIVIGAKTAEALREMNLAIKKGLVHKKYLCLVEGTPPKKQDTLIRYHSKDQAANKALLHTHKEEDSKEIRTSYTVLKSYTNYSLLEVGLHTGKSHQIRAQMAQIGTPLAGDTKYGAQLLFISGKRQYQCLYAYKITFDINESIPLYQYLSGKTFQVKDIWFLDKIKK